MYGGGGAPINCKVQIGVGESSETQKLLINSNLSIDELKKKISADQEKEPSSCNIIWNGKKLKNGDMLLGEMGITEGSRLIIIFSSTKPIDQQTKQEREETRIVEPMRPESEKEHKIVLACTFESRPFGFAVWANAHGKNAIVTKVAGTNALKLGIQIGYVVYNCNNVKVYGRPHDEVLELLKTTKCPLYLEFADLGDEYTCSFTAKPLGFTVIQDREENNAKVSKINTRAAQNLGVLIGSYVVGVNQTAVFGQKHKAIISHINRASFPINIRFRHPPPLLMLAPRRQRKR